MLRPRIHFALICLSSLCFTSWLPAQSNIDEKAVAATIYVSPTGQDANDGLTAATPQTLAGAVKTHLTDPTKIILLDGDYRTSFFLPPGDSLLVLEAEHAGKAVITGSDLVTDQVKPDGELVSLPWTYNWGVASSGFPGEWTSYNLRREMMFVDSARLLQRCDNAGKPVDKASLQAGEFTVDEDADLIHFRMPAGVALTPQSRIEVASRSNAPGLDTQSLVKVEGRSNLVFRGLVFQHNVSSVKSGCALNISGTGKESGVLIEDCTFQQNNGIGFEMSGMNHVTINRVNASNNGSRGGGFYWTRDALVEDSSFNENNWRTAPANIGHDAAGFKIFDGAPSDSYFMRMSDHLHFLRCNFNKNIGVGLWQDFTGTNTTVESCRLDNNEQGGLMDEMTPGPLLIKNCVISNNGGFGLLTYGSPNGHIEKSKIFGTRTSEIANRTDPQYCAEILLITDKRTNANLGEGKQSYGRLDHWTITDSTIQTTVESVPIFYASQYGDNPNNPPKLSFISTLTSERNHWYRMSGNNEYKADQAFYSDTVHELSWKNEFTDLTFDEWCGQPNSLGLQDQHSSWTDDDFSQVKDPTVR